MKKIIKKWWFWLIIAAVIVLLLLGLRGCKTAEITVKSGIEDSLTSSIRRGTGRAEIINVDVLMRNLVIELEPLDPACVMGEGDCLVDCFGLMFLCDDETMDCMDDCDEEFPPPDDIDDCEDNCYDIEDDCYDECDNTEGVCRADCVALYVGGELDECYDVCEYDLYGCENDCFREWDSCDYLCNEDTYICYDVCIEEFASPCFEDTVDCMYDCLEECVIGEEIVEWDGSEVTNIGEFFETSFPQFTEQFEGMCEWLIMGDFVSTENKYGCVDYMFWGDWFAFMTLRDSTNFFMAN